MRDTRHSVDPFQLLLVAVGTVSGATACHLVENNQKSRQRLCEALDTLQRVCAELEAENIRKGLS